MGEEEEGGILDISRASKSLPRIDSRGAVVKTEAEEHRRNNIWKDKLSSRRWDQPERPPAAANLGSAGGLSEASRSNLGTLRGHFGSLWELSLLGLSWGSLGDLSGPLDATLGCHRAQTKKGL